VLVARREALLQEVGRSIAADFKVDYRALAMDLSQEGFLERLTRDTNDLDIGLVVSNAGTGNPGEFLKLDRQLLQKTLRLSTMAHLDIAHYFGAVPLEAFPAVALGGLRLNSERVVIGVTVSAADLSLPP
jgi:uncharacterized protein